MLSAILLLSCSKDEPSSGGSGVRPGGGNDNEDSRLVDLQFEVDLVLPETSIERKKTLSDEYMHRFVLELHTADRETKVREVVYKSINDNDNPHIILKTGQLPGKYILVAWSDYVTTDGKKPIHYDASTLIPVNSIGDYIGNSEMKDCFFGVKEFDIKTQNGQTVTFKERIDLSRPMGRMEIVTEDVKSFIKRHEKSLADGERFSVRVVYPQYIATAFNAHDGVMKEMQSGLSFSKELNFTEDEDKMTLAFDYLFADAAGSEMPCRLEVTDGSGAKISESTVTLPIERGKNVLITGKFLTQKQNGGVSIDPDYDGVINIDLGKI